MRGEILPLPEHGHAALEDAPGSEVVIRQPSRVAGVHNEPAVAHRRNAGPDILETSLFDQEFSLTLSPNRYEIPAFYSLHVWLWQDNPDPVHGIFAPMNANVSCG